MTGLAVFVDSNCSDVSDVYLDCSFAIPENADADSATNALLRHLESTDCQHWAEYPCKLFIIDDDKVVDSLTIPPDTYSVVKRIV